MFWNKEQTMLEEEVTRAIRELRHHEVGTEKYEKVLRNLETLVSLKEEDKSEGFSKNQMAVVLGNLLGIVMIIKHEHVNVIVSRAMQLLLKPIMRA